MRRSSPQRQSHYARKPIRRGDTAPHAPRHTYIRLADGVRLHCLELGDPAGRPVILLHGLADSAFSFSRVLVRLSRAHRLLVPDLRGHGDSDGPSDGYRPREMAADVLGLMDVLGVRRATLVGHSMGTFVAQQVALAAPHRVTGMVLIASATTGSNEVLAEVRHALTGLPDEVPEAFAREFQASTTHRALPEEFMARVVAESRKAPARVWRAALEGLMAEERFTA